MMRKVKKLAVCLGLIGCVASPVYAAEEEGSKISVGGVVEVEFGSAEDFAGVKSSGAALATVEIGIQAEINSMVSSHILILHEDDDPDTWEVDEGSITIAPNPDGGPYFTGGRIYVPFGVFESNMVSDPLTLELGETREAALQFGFNGPVSASITLFNGTTIETPSVTAPDDDEMDQYVFSVGFATETDDMSFNIGLDVISSIGESGGLSGPLGDNVGGVLVEYVGGTAIHANYTNGPFNVFAELVASDQFDPSELAVDSAAATLVGAEPSATNLEFGYSFGDSTVALAIQSTSEALALGLPESVISVAYSKTIFEGASFAAEFASASDYDIADGGTGETATTITLQVAVEF